MTSRLNVPPELSSITQAGHAVVKAHAKPASASAPSTGAMSYQVFGGSRRARRKASRL